jgi:subtilase family serine protease
MIRVSPLVSAATLVLTCAFAHAQARPSVGVAGSDLVKSALDVKERVTLKGTRTRAATGSEPVADGLALARLALTLRRTPERQAAFDALLQAQQDPASPDYQRWLTPAEVGARFGASQNDIDAVTAWLRSQGLVVDALSASRTRLRFSGDAAHVAKAFGTGLAWRVEGKRRRVATTDLPSIPAALADVVVGVVGLDTPRFHPTHIDGGVRTQVEGAPRTEASSCSNGVCSYSVFPADFAHIYGLDRITANGAGESIAIVARQRVSAADVSNFQARASLPAKAIETIVPPGAVDPGDPVTGCDGVGQPGCDDPASDELGDQLEATLDVQRAGGTAPGATIKLIVADDSDTTSGVFDAAEYVIETTPPPARVLSLSFGSCEAANGADIVHAIDGLFTQAAMEGISVFVSSGDSGAADCANHTESPPAGQTAAINALCSSASVTCVGGTQFADTANPDAYWSRNNAPPGYRSALGYIPEGAWNEPLDGDGAPQLASTGGGYSQFIARPYWQNAPGTPSGSMRMTPDISLSASRHDGYFGCMAAMRDASCASVGGSFSYLVMSGTSASAPSMAGIAARLNQNAGAPQGNLNPRLYAIANAQPAAFHDATPASSGVACNVAVPSLCNNSTPGPSDLTGGLAGHALTVGYDLATGLGSPNVPTLFSAWSSVALPGVPLNQFGLSGSWANPATQSQGLVLSVQPDFYGAGSALVFGGWFTFDTSAAGGQRWYTIQGAASGVAASMPIYLTDGGRFDSSQATTTDSVGIATLHFADCGHGTLDYAFTDGRGGSIPLTRLLANIECSQAGDTSTTNASYRLTGIWADPGNDGQGLVVDVDPLQHVLFAAWYTYTANAPVGSDERQQRWYTLQASLASGATQASNFGIFASTGGVFDHAATTSTAQVGTASIVLHGCSSATLSYRFTSGSNAGKSGTLDLSRIGAAPAACTP